MPILDILYSKKIFNLFSLRHVLTSLHLFIFCVPQGSMFSTQAPDSYNLFLTSAVTDGVKMWDLRTMRLVSPFGWIYISIWVAVSWIFRFILFLQFLQFCDNRWKIIVIVQNLWRQLRCHHNCIQQLNQNKKVLIPVQYTFNIVLFLYWHFGILSNSVSLIEWHGIVKLLLHHEIIENDFGVPEWNLNQIKIVIIWYLLFRVSNRNVKW